MAAIPSEHAEASERTNNVVPISFVADVSHELRGPLHAIMGLSELLLERDIRQQDKRLIQALNTEVSTLSVIIDDLLDFARMSGKGLELESSEFSPGRLVADLVESARPKAANKGLELVLHVAPTVPAHAIGDPIRFGQVVRNLLGNAVKFTTKGHVTVSVNQVDQNLVCTVTDTGPGIKAEDTARIFEPFTQVHGTGRGAGLGLAICQQIAQLMGGDVRVSSDLGRGSEFVFTSNLASSDREVSTPKRRASDLEKLGLVLVVEDNEVNRLLASQQLEVLGYGCQLATDGESALELISQDHVAVLMDWNLPGIDGLETTRRIRSRGSFYATVPIIAMTANALGGQADQCIAAGMNDFLAKPVGLKEIEAVLQRWVTSDHVEEQESSEFLPETAISKLENELGSPEIVNQIVETFLNELESHLATFKSYTEGGEFDPARRSAHTLSSTAALLGAEKLAQLCQNLSALKTPTKESATLANDILDVAAKVRDDFTDYTRKEKE